VLRKPVRWFSYNSSSSGHGSSSSSSAGSNLSSSVSSGGGSPIAGLLKLVLSLGSSLV